MLRGDIELNVHPFFAQRFCLICCFQFCCFLIQNDAPVTFLVSTNGPVFFLFSEDNRLELDYDIVFALFLAFM